jgi:hypothetical protein
MRFDRPPTPCFAEKDPRNPKPLKILYNFMLTFRVKRPIIV